MNGNDHWDDVVKEYNDLRKNGNSAQEAILSIRKKYTNIGPVNARRLEDAYQKSSTDVISTLNLNLLTKGGGTWNTTNVNMKKSTVTTFDDKRCIKAVYDKNSGTSANPGIGGFSFSAIPDGMNKHAITFSWKVYYPKGFDFARGGKFGGPFVGYGAASGYQHSRTGASNRVMFQENGGVIDYIYPPEDLKQKIPGLVDEGHGIGFFEDDFKNALKYDSWNTIEIGTKMNTFDKNGVPQMNGESYLVVNGKKKVLKGINWSRSPDLLISSFVANTFFGGPLPSPKNQFCYFTDFQMKKYFV